MFNDFLITGHRVGLRKLRLEDMGPEYLQWMNDKELQKYTSRRNRVVTLNEVADFFNHIENSDDVHMSVFLLKGNKHIGNIALNSLDKYNRSAEVSIMIGDKSAGLACALEAFELMTKFGFQHLGLHRLWAESCNPAAIECVKRLGWKKEGERVEAVHIDGTYINYENWYVLSDEWRGSANKSR